MAKQVRIFLDTGAVLPQAPGQTYIDVGFFDPKLPADIQIFVDGAEVQPSDGKLARGKERIDIQHISARNELAGVKESGSFRNVLLRKRDLYDNDIPPFKDDAFDCVLRFHSGDFDGYDVRERCFKECSLSDDSQTGREKHHRVANDLVVDYQLEDDDVLKIVRGKEELFSTESVDKDATEIVVKVLNDKLTAPMYFKAALDHKGANCWMPNPDPPPMND